VLGSWCWWVAHWSSWWRQPAAMDEQTLNPFQKNHSNKVKTTAAKHVPHLIACNRSPIRSPIGRRWRTPPHSACSCGLRSRRPATARGGRSLRRRAACSARGPQTPRLCWCVGIAGGVVFGLVLGLVGGDWRCSCLVQDGDALSNQHSSPPRPQP